MKKLYYLIVIVLISSLVLTGCSLLSNISQVPATEQSGIVYLTKTINPTLDLVGLWHFDEGAGDDAYDSSGYNNDGTVNGAIWDDGQVGFGKALKFNGVNNYVIVPDSTSLEPERITVEAWVKSSGTPGSYRYIVSKYLPVRPGWYSSYGLYTGRGGGMQFYIGYTSGAILSPAVSKEDIWDGVWHHVAGTFDGSEVKLYVDKNLVNGVDTTTNENIYYEETGNLYIGAYTDSYLLAFSGMIDEVRIWNGALSPGQFDSVIYGFCDILPPIKVDGSRAFKLGSTVPVKFQLFDADGEIVTNAQACIFVTKTGDAIIGEIEEVSTAASTDGNLFRYDPDSEQYIFNLSTKLPLNGVSWSTGTWQIRIKLNDGTSRFVNIILK